jgi:putative transcriptional regulator
MLIAHPGLLDPNFRRSVLFVSTHDAEEGAFGLILNRPSGQTVAELLPNHDDLRDIGSVPVLLGGPVARDQLIFASFIWHSEAKRMECRHHLSVEDARQAARENRSVIRAFIGYAGWGKGQLEAELAQHAWMVRPSDEEFVSTQRAQSLWRELISTFGPIFRLTAEAPEDPSRN